MTYIHTPPVIPAFEVEKYIEKPALNEKHTHPAQTPTQKPLDAATTKKITGCIQQLERKQVDITTDYQDWLNIGFAFASIGEQGRKYYHQVSRLSDKYDPQETDKKFTRLLSEYKGQVNIGTFFHLCQKALPTIPEHNQVNVASQGIQNNIEKIKATNQFLRNNIGKPVVFSNPIIQQNEKPVIHPHTINVIQGKSGVHKSRLVEMLCSCLLSRDAGKEFLGYKTATLERFAVLYVDTERNYKDQYLYALQQIKRKAGFAIEADLPDFDFISLIEIAREQRFDTLKAYLDDVRKRFNSHIFIVLDVITDCLMNFNDPKETMKLIDLLNVMINQYNVTFLCVIHENPSSGDKARGHLGTEIMNKSSCQIQIGFEKDKNQNDTDLIKVKYLKTRIGKRPEPFYLVYSEEEKGLVVAEREYIQEIAESRKAKAIIDDVKDFLEAELSAPMERKKLLEVMTAHFSCSKNTAIDRLKQLIEGSDTFYNAEGVMCALSTKAEKGGKILYELAPTEISPE